MTLPIPVKLKIAESSQEYKLDMKVLSPRYSLTTGTVIVSSTSEEYDGDYAITPNFDEQVLNTKYKFLKQDLTVEAIPVSRTTNLSGGTTIYIGGIFDNG